MKCMEIDDSRRYSKIIATESHYLGLSPDFGSVGEGFLGGYDRTSCTKMRVVKHEYRSVLEAKRIVVVDPKLTCSPNYIVKRRCS